MNGVSFRCKKKGISLDLSLFTIPSAGEKLPSEIEGYRSNCFFTLTPSGEKSRDAQSKERRLAFASLITFTNSSRSVLTWLCYRREATRFLAAVLASVSSAITSTSFRALGLLARIRLAAALSTRSSRSSKARRSSMGTRAATSLPFFVKTIRFLAKAAWFNTSANFKRASRAPIPIHVSSSSTVSRPAD